LPTQLSAARGSFLQATEMGNAEAMAFLGKMYWSGWGVATDPKKAREWLQAGADRGDVVAMKGLANIYSTQGPDQNSTEAKRWRSAAAEAERLKEGIVLVDPSGKADRGEPRIPAQDVLVAPPTNLRIE
jgi:TPR repeat protein